MSQEEYKKDSPSRFPGLNRSSGNGDDKSQRKGPKFSIYWIYALVALFLIGYQVLKGVTPDATNITELKFRQEKQNRSLSNCPIRLFNFMTKPNYK